MEHSHQRSQAPQRESTSRTTAGRSANPFSLLNLQESLGNQALLGLLASGRLQPKLAVNQPGDVYEQEADRVAQAVVSGASPPIVQRKCACGGTADAGGECADCRKKKEEGLVQREAAGAAGQSPPVPTGFASQLAALQGSGAPLSPAQRDFFEPRFGHDFGAVRLHTGPLAERSAAAVQARAFTLGNDVVFGRGEYAPETSAGRLLLAHELTHVVQQTPFVHRAPAPPKKLKAKRFAGNSTLNLVLNNLKTLKFNDVGEPVRLIQESLIAQGFPMPRRAADGIFKEETKATLEDYQATVGLVADGKVGPLTMEELDRRDPTAEDSADESSDDVAKHRPPKVPLKLEGSLKPGEKGFEGGCAVHFKPVKFIGPFEKATGGKKGMKPFQVGNTAGNPGRIKMTGRNKHGEPIGYQPQIQIQAPSAEVASEYEVGFSQNVVASDRRALYDNGGSVASVIASLPIRDAMDDADPVFIVQPPKAGLVESFQSANDTRTLTWGDTPGVAFNARLQDECSGAPNALIRRFIMSEVFVLLVIARHKRTGCILPLQNVRWGVNYSMDVSFDKDLNATFQDVQDKNFVSGQGTEIPSYVQGGPRAGDSVSKVCVPGQSQKGAGNSASPPAVQRKAAGGSGPATAPPAVSEALGAAGQPLDRATRADLEPRFGRSFEDVRVHTGERAAAAARSVDALAFTVGRDVVFGDGQYAPGIPDGKRLLAHELTHVAQQEVSPGSEVLQRQQPPPTAPTQTPSPKKSKLDATALSIIQEAQDQAADVEARARKVVERIIHEYYPTDEANVSQVVYDDKQAGDGLAARPPFNFKDKDYRGKIFVGKAFLATVDEKHFARRVLQVGHELEHIRQYRAGMSDRDEREFLAHYHAATAQEKPGTGTIQRSTRVDMIDTAIGYYYCLPNDPQKKTGKDKYTAELKELQTKRQVEIDAIKSKGYKLQNDENPPTECKRP